MICIHMCGMLKKCCSCWIHLWIGWVPRIRGENRKSKAFTQKTQNHGCSEEAYVESYRFASNVHLSMTESYFYALFLGEFSWWAVEMPFMHKQAHRKVSWIVLKKSEEIIIANFFCYEHNYFMVWYWVQPFCSLQEEFSFMYTTVLHLHAHIWFESRIILLCYKLPRVDKRLFIFYFYFLFILLLLLIFPSVFYLLTAAMKFLTWELLKFLQHVSTQSDHTSLKMRCKSFFNTLYALLYVTHFCPVK